MPSTQARRLVLHGHVQGVFFRDSMRRQAVQRSVAGWAANRRDGTVEAWVEGEPDALERMVDWCRTRAPGSVERVEVEAVEPRGLRDFEVR